MVTPHSSIQTFKYLFVLLPFLLLPLFCFTAQCFKKKFAVDWVRKFLECYDVKTKRSVVVNENNMAGDVKFFCISIAFCFVSLPALTQAQDSEYYYESHDHHRSRRSVSAFDPPSPSYEFPAVLFSDLNFNNATSSGYYHQLRPDHEYRVWGRTIADGVRQFEFRSMMFMPGVSITFKACCLTGNTWTRTVSDVHNISNIHLWMFDKPIVGGSDGIFYTSWTQWMMDFSMRVSCPIGGCDAVNCSKTCYFGTCGIDQTCQCTNGHSGLNCETRPLPSEPFPTLQHPLLLFPQKNFKGTPVKVAPGKMTAFAVNKQKVKSITYHSLRVLYTRPLIFSRIDHQVTTRVAIGSDIENIEGYMASNPDIANGIWFGYASDIPLEFGVKVDDVPACTKCSLTGGCCYTGRCVCLPGYSGSNCENP